MFCVWFKAPGRGFNGQCTYQNSFRTFNAYESTMKLVEAGITYPSIKRSVGADCGTEKAASGFRRDDSRMQAERYVAELCTYPSADSGVCDRTSARNLSWHCGLAARKTGFHESPPMVTSRFANRDSSIVCKSCSCVMVPCSTAYSKKYVSLVFPGIIRVTAFIEMRP